MTKSFCGPDLGDPGVQRSDRAQVLAQFCGRDISQAFHGGESGHRHSRAAEELLKSFGATPVKADRASCSQPRGRQLEGDPVKDIQTAFTAGLPVLGIVGRLGPSYNEWVHSPEAGQPRFFQSNWAEAVTKTSWQVLFPS